MPNPCRPRANTCSSDGRSAADQSACRPSTILHEDVVLRDRGEQRRRIGGHRRAPRLAAVDRRDERELVAARVERDVDGEERAGREADHADRCPAARESRRVLADELDRAAAVVGRRLARCEVLGGRDQVADRAGLLRLGSGTGRPPSMAAIVASNVSWSAVDACTRYFSRKAV